MFVWLKKTFWMVVAWFRPEAATSSPVEPPKAKTEADIYAAGLVPPPVPPPVPQLIHRPGKFVKPKGELPPKIKREPSTEPKKPRKPRPIARASATEDPEQWGQYYFRDAILDQLDTYFIYLKRMRKGDRDAYDLHRQMGIQIMPGSAVQTFDNWRNAGEIDELSAWWKETRPSFGAVAYGIDKKSMFESRQRTVDAPPEFFKTRAWKREEISKFFPKNRIGTLTRGATDIVVAPNKKERDGILWVPKFLYFFKFKKVTKKLEPVKNSDIYMMTVYWDRTSGLSRTYHKRHPGGVPQEYALCIDRDTSAIRVMRQQITDTIRVKSRHSDKGFISIPHKYWTSCADSYLSWAFGRDEASPENYLIRCFIEAALMYESSTMGSMVRVQVSKGDLVATFGVDIKRMSYFFKDRDIVLTPKGKRARIFHIVRPHTRQTKKGEVGVKLTFRGLKQFTWANYKISITVPGRDHLNLSEMPVAASHFVDDKPRKGNISTKEFGARLTGIIKEGRGAWRAKET